jgi:hypothetical protein
MRQNFPSSRQILIFAIISITLAVVVSTLSSAQHDLGLSFLAMPLFVFAAVMGLRKNWAQMEDAE